MSILRFYRYNLTLVVNIVFFVSLSFLYSQVAFPSSSLIVTNLVPAPNYKLTTDDLDILQLYDNKTTPYPIWINPESVGWSRANPISISVTIGTEKSRNSGKLRLHTATKASAGVYLPSWIDVYGSEDSKNWLHLNSGATPIDYADAKNYWIEIDISDAPAYLNIVIHAVGEYFMLDEIQWVSSSIPAPKVRAAGDLPDKSQDIFTITKNNDPVLLVTSYPTIKANALSADSLTKDSIARLKNHLLYKTDDLDILKQEWITAFGKNNGVVWVQNPWSDLEKNPTAEYIKQAQAQGAMLLFGAKDEKESGCIGVLNPSAQDVQMRVKLEGSTAISNSAVIGLVQPISAANGKLVYDPITTVAASQSITLKAYSAAYIWLTLDLKNLPIGTSNANVVMTVADSDIRIPLEIRSFDIRTGEQPVKSINWGYATDLPIWANPAAAMEDQKLHGTNMFVVPPSVIPLPSMTRKFSVSDFSRLSNYLGILGNQGEFLLFLQLDGYSQSSLDWLKNDANADAAVREWLSVLSSVMTTAGIPQERWALYPIDEPSGKHTDFLLSVITKIKSADSRVRIYANIINTFSNPTTIADLKKLAPYVDIWQPVVDFAESQDFFSQQKNPWGIYFVSKGKSESPLNYRLFSWRAARLRATMVGFWSYSRVYGASAWDDFDASRPDEAVVYEGNPIVSSRRWEAWREGVEDLRLLLASEWRALDKSVSVTEISQIETLRLQTLQALTP